MYYARLWLELEGNIIDENELVAYLYFLYTYVPHVQVALGCSRSNRCSACVEIPYIALPTILINSASPSEQERVLCICTQNI